MKLSIVTLVSLIGLSLNQAQVPQPYPQGHDPSPIAPFLPPSPNPAPLYPVTPNLLTPYPAADSWNPKASHLPPATQRVPVAPKEPSNPTPTPMDTPLASTPVPLACTPIPVTEPMKSRLFEIYDVVCPNLTSNASTHVNSQTANAESLMKLIVAVVKPKTWERNGGKGKVQYIHESNSICLTNTPTVLNAVAEVLDGLRKTESQIVVEMQIVSVTEGNAAKAGWPCDGKPKNFKHDDVLKTLKAMKEDKQIDMLSAPKMTMLDGQMGSFCVSQEIPNPSLPMFKFVTPKRKSIELKCTPTIMLDGKSIDMKVVTTLENPTLNHNCTYVVPVSESTVTRLGSVDVPKIIAAQGLTNSPVSGTLIESKETTKREYYQIVTTKIVQPTTVVTDHGQVFTFHFGWIGGQ